MAVCYAAGFWPAVMLQKLEKYELLEEIGHGGMATVYRARDERLDRLVALKVMHPHLRSAQEARVRFTREARSVARLKHPNILEVYDYSGEDSDECYIAAELLTGPTLKEYISKQGHVPAEVAACVTIEIARALRAAHENGIVHRDVKPENVLMHDNRCVKLADFGIAQMVDAQGFTATGQILGSPGHMAPEQIEGKDCDERTDLFSLGTVLYFLAAGELPFTGRNPHVVLRRIMDAEFVDPLQVKPTMGEPLARIIRQAMARDPAERYQTAEELERDLSEFVAFAGITDSHSYLSEYLQEPEAVATALTATLIERLTKAGEVATKGDEVQRALEYFNRALALDEGNKRVLSLIQRIGRRQARRRAVLLTAGTLFAIGGVVGIGYALSEAIAANSHGQDAGVIESSDGAVPRDGSTNSVDAGAAGVQDVARGASDGGERDGASPFDLEPRLVTFRPVPQNVAIGIDGSPPRPFGPEFRQTRLIPGVHRIRIVPGAGNDCCEPADFRVNIPPGDTPFVLDRALRPRPARLYVQSNTPAAVVVENGVARGRARDFVTVPLDRVEQVRRFTVTAPGIRRIQER